MANEEQIKARFLVKRSSVTVFASYGDVGLSMTWGRTPKSTQYMETLAEQATHLVREALNEVAIADSTKSIDQEYRQMFPDLEDGEFE